MCVSTYTNCTGIHTHTDHSSAPANTPLSRTLHSVSGNHWMRIVNVLLHQTNKFVKSLHAHTHANTVFAAWIRRLWCEKKKRRNNNNKSALSHSHPSTRTADRRNQWHCIDISRKHPHRAVPTSVWMRHGAHSWTVKSVLVVSVSKIGSLYLS